MHIPAHAGTLLGKRSDTAEIATPESLPIPLTALSTAQKTALINLVRRTAKAEITPRFRNLGHANISSKSSPYDLVTEADLAAEAMLARGIQGMFPHALVVGEEAASSDPKLRGKIDEAKLAFILDPVDGTWNFAHGLPLFGVILAATRFGKPVFGLLYDPVMDDWITADLDDTAYLSRNIGAARPLSVSRGGDLSALSGYVHLYLMPEEVQGEMARRLPDFARTLMLCGIRATNTAHWPKAGWISPCPACPTHGITPLAC